MKKCDVIYAASTAISFFQQIITDSFVAWNLYVAIHMYQNVLLKREHCLKVWGPSNNSISNNSTDFYTVTQKCWISYLRNIKKIYTISLFPQEYYAAQMFKH